MGGFYVDNRKQRDDARDHAKKQQMDFYQKLAVEQSDAVTTTAELSDAICLAAADDGVRLFPQQQRRRQARQRRQDMVRSLWRRPTDGGGGDWIGWRIRDGKFVSIEIKVGQDRQHKEQAKWEKWVKAGNGLAGVARSVEDAREIWNA